MRHTCSTCGYCKSGALLSEIKNGITEDPCKTCEVITVNEFTNWHPIPITNADRIRSMNDEELADWLVMNGDGSDYKTHLAWLKKEVSE